MDSLKLKAKRIEKGKIQQDMASALGISIRAYVFKENGQTEFKNSETLKIKDVLELSDEEFCDIFLNS